MFRTPLMILLDPSEDRFHNLEDSGSYEWTYFDGMSEDGDYGFTAIWFRGIPMSPRYTAAIDRDPANALPGKYCAFAFGLYYRGKRIASAIEEGPESLFTGDAASPDVRFGENALYAAQGKDGEIGYRMTFNIRRPLLAGRVMGEITFRFPSGDLSGASVPYAAGRAKHCWVPVAPNGSFTAAIDLAGIAGAPARHRFGGRAYHDRNFGTEPLHSLDADWHWGRFHFGSKAFVFFEVFFKDSQLKAQRFQRMLLFEGGKLIESAEEFSLSPISWRKHWATLPYPEVVEGSDPSGEFRFAARTRSLVDSGPFYHRIVADFELSFRGERVEGRGMTEYLRPRRLGVSFFRPFVKFRMRRRSSR